MNAHHLFSMADIQRGGSVDLEMQCEINTCLFFFERFTISLSLMLRREIRQLLRLI